MSENKKLVPKRRFKEFENTDAWEQHKLGEDLVQVQTGTNKLGTTEDKGMPLIKMGNIQRGYFNLDKLEKLQIEDMIEPENILSFGDFLFNTRNTLALVGKGATWFGTSNTHGFNSNIARFTFKGINTTFFNYLYNTRSVLEQVLARAVGTTSVAAIYPRDIKSINYYIPHADEQHKIGTLFKTLDDTIAFQQRKLEKMKSMKSAYLSEMFPAEGERKPKRRFPGFTDDWEQRELGNYVSITTGKLDANAMKEDGEYDFFTSGIQKYKIDVPAFEGPAITIAGNGATVGYMHYADGMFNAYQRTYVLTDFLVDRHFIFQMIGRTLPKKISQEARTGNIPYIVMDMLSELKVSLPSIKEQTKIGVFFYNLDQTIAFQQQKLEKLQNIKKAYLNEMFI